jgi:hypothetical protein
LAISSAAAPFGVSSAIGLVSPLVMVAYVT